MNVFLLQADVVFGIILFRDFCDCNVFMFIIMNLNVFTIMKISYFRRWRTLSSVVTDI